MKPQRTPTKRCSRPRGRLFLFLTAAATFALLAIALGAYRFALEILRVDSGDVQAQAMVVLGGDPIWRPVRAIELFRAGAAPLLLVSGSGDCQTVRDSVVRGGVPPDRVVTECESGSTWENAQFSVRLLRQRGITNAIIVTSWYHSRRALACFRRAAPEIRFYSRPSYANTNRSEWPNNGTGVHIRLEYLKILAYLLRYGICPW